MIGAVILQERQLVLVPDDMIERSGCRRSGNKS